MQYPIVVYWMLSTPPTNLFVFKGQRDLALISCQCSTTDLHVDDGASGALAITKKLIIAKHSVGNVKASDTFV